MRKRRLAGATALTLLAGLVLVGVTDRPPQHRPTHQAERLEAGGITVRAVRAGNGPRTLVLLHGFGEHLLTWRMVFDALARSGRVVALDLPGFGGSDKPPEGYTLEAMTQWLAAFITRWTQPPVVLVGHSMGGQLAASLALSQPDLVERLVLIAPAGYQVGLGGIADGITPTRATAIGLWEAARSFVTPMHDPGWMEEPEPQDRYDPTFDPAFAHAVERILLEFDFLGLRHRYTEIAQPTLLLWGRFDPVIPPAVGDTLASLLRCRHYYVLDKTLHRPQVERPDTVVTLIQHFLHQTAC